jgi:hypothetical protein
MLAASKAKRGVLGVSQRVNFARLRGGAETGGLHIANVHCKIKPMKTHRRPSLCTFTRTSSARSGGVHIRLLILHHKPSVRPVTDTLTSLVRQLTPAWRSPRVSTFFENLVDERAVSAAKRRRFLPLDTIYPTSKAHKARSRARNLVVLIPEYFDISPLDSKTKWKNSR